MKKELDALRKSNAQVREFLCKDSETEKVNKLREEMKQLEAKKDKSRIEYSRLLSLLKYFKLA